MTGALTERYRALLHQGILSSDPAQSLAVEKLQLLANRLERYKPPQRSDFFSFFSGGSGQPPEGLYLFGGIGRGKTMLMDMFFESVPFSQRRRLHFHEFMAEVHQTIARLRRMHDGDPIPLVARILTQDARLLCLDELQVTDIADAMILGRLFGELFRNDLVIVATSNMPPERLYWNGLNRALFLPFIGLIKKHMELFQLESAQDYRLDKLHGAPLYFTPLGEEADAAVEALWRRLTSDAQGEPQELHFLGRALDVPCVAMGVARFDFADLFVRPLGPNDYLALAHHFHTVIVEHIPQMRPEQRNEARRFITFIDTLYDHRTGLVASAAAEPEALYPQGDDVEMFARTASRLMEMRCEAYLSGDCEGRGDGRGDENRVRST